MMPLKSDISITYIPASDAAVFKATAITRLGTTSEQPQQVRRTLYSGFHIKCYYNELKYVCNKNCEELW